MSYKEFLARWSRRKREAKAVIDTPASVEPAPSGATGLGRKSGGPGRGYLEPAANRFD